MAEQRALIWNGDHFEEIKDDDIGTKKIVVYEHSLGMYKERIEEEGFPFVSWLGLFKQFFTPDILIGEGEPAYNGYQLWFHEDIPDYNNPDKNVLNLKYSIKNYLI